MVVMTSES